MKLGSLSSPTSKRLGNTSIPQRNWLQLSPEMTSSPQFHLRVMSYNILAPCYMFQKYFPFAQKEHLNWRNRSNKIIKEIKAFNYPEIMSFQEYQKIYTDSLQQFLTNQGYKHTTGFKIKKQEGLAIFYKEENFHKVWQGYLDLNIARHLKEFYQFDTDTCAIFCLLKSNHHANHHFLVINTHLLYNPTKGNEKLAEIIIIIKTIEKIKAKFSHLDNIHVIFKGDFNFLPSSSLYNFMVDGIFQPNQFSEHNVKYSSQLFNQSLHNLDINSSEHFYMSTRKIQLKENMYTYKELKNKELFQNLCKIDVDIQPFNIKLKMSETNESEILYKEGRIINKSPFKSVYSEFYKKYSKAFPYQTDSNVQKHIECLKMLNPQKQNSQMTYESSQTQLAANFRATVDYIWTSSSQVSPVSIYQALDYSSLCTFSYIFNTCLDFPNDHYPSDHMSLCSDLSFQLNKL